MKKSASFFECVNTERLKSSFIYVLRITYFAMPKNTAKLRSTSNNESPSIRPKGCPSLLRFTVIALLIVT